MRATLCRFAVLFCTLSLADCRSRTVPPSRHTQAEESTTAATSQLRQTYPAVEVKLDDVTHLATSVRTGATQASTSALPPATPEDAALRFLNTEAKDLFAVAESGTEYRVKRSDPAADGAILVRAQQYVRSIPVFGGEVVVEVTASAAPAVRHATSSISSVMIDQTVPAVSGSAAAAIAVNELKARAKNANDGVAIPDTATSPELVIWDPSRLGLPGEAALAWLVDVVEFRVFVNAVNGRIEYTYRPNPEVLNRKTFDCASLSCTLVLGDSPPVAASSVSQDATIAHEAAKEAYEWYRLRWGRDGFDDTGSGGSASTLIQTRVNNYRNAGYEAQQKRFRFGAGWSTRDLVAHEYAHAVMMHRPSILTLGQPGAVHEYFADLFAALLDDAPPSRWVIGERVSSPPGNHGFVRDLRRPHANGFNRGAPYDAASNNGQPEHTGEYVSPTDPICASWGYDADNGCVHYNGAILSRAAVLAVDGGSLNGISVLTRVPAEIFAHISYEALLRLPTAVSLQAVVDEMLARCDQMASGAAAGVTSAHCASLRAAYSAVRLVA